MLLNAGVPPILRSRMISRRSRLSLLPVQVLPIRPPGHSIVLVEETSPTEFGDEQVDDVLECTGFDGVCLPYVSIGWYRYTVRCGENLQC
jgi:hypothetical protein